VEASVAITASELKQMREDVAAGRYTCQGADAHVARVKDELTNRPLPALH
jgi:hypothetical protein